MKGIAYEIYNLLLTGMDENEVADILNITDDDLYEITYKDIGKKFGDKYLHQYGYDERYYNPNDGS